MCDVRSMMGNTRFTAPLALPMSPKPALACARPIAAKSTAMNARSMSSNVTLHATQHGHHE